jgi:predicted transposase YbfD/YdcC
VLKKMPNFTSQITYKNTFSTFFAHMTDPRRINKGNHRYPLDEIFFLVISAVISGCEGWESINEFGASKLNWLRAYYPYKNGIPSHDVLNNVFARLDTKSFNQCFADWVNSISKLTDGEVVAIDGKTIRKSNNKNTSKSAFHLVSAYASENKVCLGQEVVDDKHNEITAIPKLLDLLAIKGCIVTSDAMGCQTKIAEKIIEKKADYLLAAKGNQKELKTQIIKTFDQNNPISIDTSVDAGHGRVETRTCEVIDDLRFFDEKERWTKLKSIVRITSERYNKSTKQTSSETRYYITSLEADAAKINNAVRKHWTVENNLHWTLDVIFKEDESLKKKDASPVNFNIVRKIALAMIEKEDSIKKSKNVKRLKAALDDKYRTKILNL